MGDETCPRCGKPRPRDFPQCICGYNYVSGQVEPRTVDEERFIASFNIVAPPRREPGSFPVGFIAGLVLGLFALIGARVMKAPDDTQRGIVVGIVIQFVVAFTCWILLR